MIKSFLPLSNKILRYNKKYSFNSARSLAISSTTNSSSLCSISLLEAIRDPKRAKEIAIRDTTTKIPIVLTYEELDEVSTKFANYIVKNYPSLSPTSSSPSNLFDSSVKSIGCFNKPGSLFAISMLASWKLGKIFVPLSVNQSAKELEYVIDDSKTELVLYSDDSLISEEIISTIKKEKLNITNLPNSSLLSTSPSDTSNLLLSSPSSSPSLVLYTSGTTGKPKGVLHTHSSIEKMMNNLILSWNITDQDKLLHFLPLYHMHGLVNKFLTLLKSGGEIEFIASAKPSLLFSRLLDEYNREKESNDKKEKKLTLLMGVPTVYSNILEAVIEKKLNYTDEELEKIRTLLQSLRLHICGSAALPDILMNSWQKFSGKVLLERYGMTEIGMALSNPYNEFDLKMNFHNKGEEDNNKKKEENLIELVENQTDIYYNTKYEISYDENMNKTYDFYLSPSVYSSVMKEEERNKVKINRRRGYVGLPLEDVECKIVDENGQIVKEPFTSGELYIRGPNVFAEYINKPEATKESFENDIDSKYSWFKTGDVAERDRDGYYKILGRKSADIIKSAGYKLSALEIERELLSHPQIAETAVVGIPDEKLGEKIITFIVLRSQFTKEDNFKNEYILNFLQEEKKVNGSLVSAVEFSEENSSKLKKYLSESLSYYKLPKNYYFVSSIPRNNIGKINKKSLMNHFNILK